MKEIKFAKMYDDVKIPHKREEDAGFDIYAHFDEEYNVIMPHETKIIPTGLISVLPKNHVAILKERGSTGTKGMGQRAGVIDEGFRGEWMVPITNHTDVPLVIMKNVNGDDPFHGACIKYPYSKAICQAVIFELPRMSVKEISLEDAKNHKSIRGDGMLGSSGK